jgi:hypothetical protein
MGNLFDELQYVTICDECDTLATLSAVGDTITIVQCACVQQLFTTPENN